MRAAQEVYRVQQISSRNNLLSTPQTFRVQDIPKEIADQTQFNFTLAVGTF